MSRPFSPVPPVLTVLYTKSNPQVDLITAIHDVLAKFGLCCVGEDGIGVDGTFLKLAIKHLLAMKIKSSHHSMSKESNGFNDDAKVSADRPSTGPESGELFAPDSISSVESEQGESLEDRSTNTLSNQQEMNKQVSRAESELAEDEREELESAIDNALNQCFYCLYGLNLRSDTAFEDDLAVHRNTSQADYQSKEQCADVFKYILPYAKASTVSFFLIFSYVKAIVSFRTVVIACLTLTLCFSVFLACIIFHLRKQVCSSSEEC